MATIQKFEDLVCWQKARLLTKEIYGSLNVETFKRLNLSADYGFIDQIQRAAVSVMSNIAEGFERGTRAELINYLFIAKGSCGEVRCQLYVALDNGYLNEETFKRLKSLSEDCSILIYRFIQSVKQSGISGHQYKREKSRAELDREEFDDLLARSIKEGKDITEYEEFKRMEKEIEERKRRQA